MDFLMPILYTILTACGVTIAAQLLRFVNAKIDAAQININNEKFNNAIDYAQGIIETAVMSVSQTYVDGLKASGKFDGSAAQAAKEQAMEIATEFISEDGREAIEAIYGDFTAYLEHAIEQYVKANK